MFGRRTRQKKEFEKVIVFVDIDETICRHEESDPSKARDYNRAIPIVENIEKVNAMYDNGDTVVYWTARGAKTGFDWSGLTSQQLQAWGCKYHELRLDKPYFDLFIDDKVLNTKDWE